MRTASLIFQEVQALCSAAHEAERLCVACQCGNLDLETYDGGEHFHCYNGAGHGWTQFVINDADRIAAEKKAAAAVRMLDEASAPTVAVREAGQLNRGVRLGWLKQFMDEHGCADKTTAEVVRDIVKPLTRSTRCRFVELPGLQGGLSKVFVSHTWGAPFSLLVAALRRALDDDDDVVVWCDIFAVRQWGGNDADLVFEPVVAGTDALVLVGTHVNSIAQMSSLKCISATTAIPADALRRCV